MAISCWHLTWCVSEKRVKPLRPKVGYSIQNATYLLHHFYRHIWILPFLGHFLGIYMLIHATSPIQEPPFLEAWRSLFFRARRACAVSQGLPWRHWGEWRSAAVRQLPPFSGPKIHRSIEVIRFFQRWFFRWKSEKWHGHWYGCLYI